MTHEDKAETYRRQGRDELGRNDAKSLGRGVGYALLSISHELAQAREETTFDDAMTTILEEIDG